MVGQSECRMADSGAVSSKVVEWIFNTTITPVSTAHKDEGECIISGGTHSGKPKGHNAKFIHCIGVVQWNSTHFPRRF
jgi:hypothetical protein